MHSPESEREHPNFQEAASEALIESALPLTSQSEAVISEVAEVAEETGLLEAARTADLISDSLDADSVLRVVGQAALKSGSLDYALRREYFLMRRAATARHSYATVRQRRLANLALETGLEINARLHMKGEETTE